MLVRLSYRVFDAEGEQVGEGEPAAPLGAIFGYGELLPALERALDGKTTGERATLELAPREAYGERDPKALIEVDREEFPADVAPGDRFEAERDEGGIVVLKVLDVTEDAVVVDLNHPLAGQKVRYELEVVEVRPATPGELEQAVFRLEAPEAPGPEGLIPLGRLLTGGRRRYEDDSKRSADDEEPGEPNGEDHERE